MDLIREYSTDITIHAPAIRVWETITRADLVRQYLNGVDVESSWKVGESITYKHPWEGKIHEDKGEIVAIEPEKLLKFKYLPVLGELEDTPENYQEMTFELTAISPELTTVRIAQTNIRDDFFGTRAPEIWGEVLRSIKEVSERQ